MGAGFGVMLIGSMVVIARWFPPDRFSTMSSFVMSVGLIGNLLATTPLAWGAEAFGWRAVFSGGVLFTFAAALAVLAIVRDAPAGHPFLAREPETMRDLFRGLGEVLANRQLHLILVLNFCNYACTFTIQGLWGGPYLREVHGLSKIDAGNALLGAVVAYQIGILVIGPMDRVMDTRKWISFSGTLVVAAIIGALALWPGAPAWAGVGAILAIGFFSACSTMVMAHGRGIIPDRLIGRGMATINTAVMLGVACMQSLSGVIVGAFEPLASGARSETAYRALFAVLACVLVAAACVYGRSRDVKPSEEMARAR